LREGVAERRKKLGAVTKPQECESLIRFVYANFATDDPGITLQEGREVQPAATPSSRWPVSSKGLIQIHNLAGVKEAISVCAEQERSLRKAWRADCTGCC